MGFVRMGIACLAGLAMVACGPSNPEPLSPIKEKSVYVRPAANADVVECLDPKSETPAWISNGSVGVRVARDGSGAISGESSSSIFDVTKYDPTGEEKIQSGVCPLPLNVCLDGEPILSGDVSGYRQVLELGSLPFKIKSTWKQGAAEITVTNTVDSRGRIQFGFHVYKTNAKLLTLEYDSPSLNEVSGLWEMRGETLSETGSNPRIVRIWGQGDVSYNLKLVHGNSRTKIEVPIREGQLHIILEHDFGKLIPYISEPSKSFGADIEIDGPVEDQQAIRSFLTYLRGSVPIDSETPVSPLNSSGTTYNGHVFWDADLWVFPALALLDPERAKTITNYRIMLAGAAEKNFKERKSWVRNAPTGEAVANVDALQYPWESSVSGLEVSPTETKQQHHITADVVWGLDTAAALGLVDAAKVEAIGKKAARFYQFRASKVEIEKTEGSHYDFRSFRSILDTVSPDEHFFGDHDLYTNAIAEWTVKRFDPADKGLPFFLPRDGAGFLNYGGDRMKGYKQAAGALAIYPLQNPAVEKEAKLFMDRFGDKVSKNGPAMTDSVHALIWARMGEKGKAYETWRRSWMEFTNHPLMLFSEKRNKDVTYFSTGAAGCLQTVLYGFLGIRIDWKAQPGAKWSIPLKGGKVLSIKPNLPDEWKSVKLKGLTILGKRYEVVVRGDEVTVTLMK